MTASQANFGELRGDQRQEFVHFQCGREDFLQIVKLCQPGNRIERAVAFLFVGLRSGNRDTCHVRGGKQCLDRFLRDLFFKCQYLQGSDQIFAAQKGNVADGEQRLSRVNVRVIFSLQVGRLLQDRSGIFQQAAENPSASVDRLLVDRGFADSCSRNPEVAFSIRAQRIHAHSGLA